MLNVSVVVVNFDTLGLTRVCVRSFRSHYSQLPFFLINNGGPLDGVKNIQVIENKSNVGHGPALHQGILLTQTRYVFTLDSDTETREGGFLEAMAKAFEKDPKLFAIGSLWRVNPGGVRHKDEGAACKRGLGYDYVHPYAALLDKEKYGELKPFQHRGAPAIQLMIDAVQKGYRLANFPIDNYIWHKTAGTRKRYGGSWRGVHA